MHMVMEQEAFLYLILLFLASSLFLSMLAKNNKAKGKKVPSGPWRLPILGNLHLLNPNKPHRSLLTFSNKHGPLILLKLGSIPTLVVSSCNIAEEIFTNHDLTFSGRPLLTAAKKLTYNFSSIGFAPHGEHWRQARKMAMLELLSPRCVRSFEAVRQEEVEKLVAAIKGLSVANLSELMLSLTNNVVCRVALGDEFGDGGYGGKGGAHLHQLLSETQSLLAGFCVADYFPGMEWVDWLRGFHGRLERNFEETDKFLDRVIWEHLKKEEKEKEKERDININDGGEREDMVDVLLRLHKDAVLCGGFLSNIDHVKAILLEAFIAGTDTTSATITWTMAELFRNPRVMNKLQDELKQAISGNTCRLIQESELEKLAYLKQVIKESLRLRPSVPLLPRETIQPCEIQGYMIPANTRVIFNATAISTDPKVWEKPLEFWPERFNESKVDFKGQDFELLPFGSGRRKCPGTNFAMVVIELALANLLHCFDWSMTDEMKAEDINMEEAIGITTHKKVALCLVAKSKW